MMPSSSFEILLDILKLCGLRSLIFIIFLIFCTSVFELLLLASVLPTVAYVSGFETNITWKIDEFVRQLLGQGNSQQELTFIYVSAFAAFTLVASIFRIATLYYSSKISFLAAEHARKNICNSVLKSDYTFISSLNSSDLALVIGEKSALVGPLTNELLTIINSALVAFVIFMLLLNLDSFMVGAMFLLGAMYVVITLIVRNKLVRNSKVQNLGLKSLSRLARISITGIIDLKINNITDKVLDSLSQYGDNQLSSMRSSWFISRVPRYLMEGGSILLLALLLIIFVNEGQSGNEIVPVFAVLGLGSQRLLPLMQQAFHAYSFISSNMDQLAELRKYLNFDNKIGNSSGYDLSAEKFEVIEISDVMFSYPQSSSPAVKNFNLCLHSGQFVALQGPSGCGKSTILKLASGLLSPESGRVSVNARDLTSINISTWFKKISYVTQDVQLVDGTVMENATHFLGDDIDHERLFTCLKLSCFVGENAVMNEVWKIRAGEDGSQISGGQKQRLGIAFSLYKKPDILFLDEATSGLSISMEAKVLTNIRRSSPQLSLIAITHRTENLMLFDDVKTVCAH